MEVHGGTQTAVINESFARCDSLRRGLEQARLRTLELLSAWPDEHLSAQFSPLLSPLIWDLAHIANHEERWLVRALGGERVLSVEMEKLYDATAHPRSARSRLPLLSMLQATEYAGIVRRKALELLDAQAFDTELTHRGFIYALVLQHEHQHVETMLAAIQHSELAYPLAPAFRARLITAPKNEPVFHEGGDFIRGSTLPWAYDNEQPAHVAFVRPFLLDAHPATNAQFVEFVEAGGYETARYWSRDGFAFARTYKLTAPKYWIRDSHGQHHRTRFGHFEPLPLHEPVQHISFYEAEAFARFCGKRLPTELEWECAARSAAPDCGNLWHDGMPHPYAPLPVASLPESSNGPGVQQLFGNVWEWCSSSFAPYPGFRAFPYPEYSASFFDGRYRVLRGGSWATHPSAMRSTFRNWDYPTRRHLFAGVRCAQDA